MRPLLWLVIALTAGCYRYVFEQQPIRTDQPVVTHVARRATWLNGFIGAGEIDVTAYCERPVQTALKVRASDVLISVVTLLIYTPHTLYVTCPQVTDQTASLARDQP
jgi:hypothetical protein